MHRVDHAEIVIDFERARLDALAARAGAMIGRRRVRLDEAEIDAAARQIAGQHQAGETRAGDQNVGHEYAARYGSSFTLASVMTLLHSAVSALKNLALSSSEPPTTSAFRFSNRDLTVGSRSASLMSALILATIA